MIASALTAVLNCRFTTSNQCMMAKATCSAYYPKSSICYVELSLFQFQNKKVTCYKSVVGCFMKANS